MFSGACASRRCTSLDHTSLRLFEIEADARAARRAGFQSRRHPGDDVGAGRPRTLVQAAVDGSARPLVRLAEMPGEIEVHTPALGMAPEERAPRSSR
ncbi:MAG TPA: hypothetical protein PKO41_00800 [Dokdonella sp.]|nr:hypothetical protein [Dokdonella sp.]HNR90938.1 hypothetical protein [Dokdonella sp.]